MLIKKSLIAQPLCLILIDVRLYLLLLGQETQILLLTGRRLEYRRSAAPRQISQIGILLVDVQQHILLQTNPGISRTRSETQDRLSFHQMVALSHKDLIHNLRDGSHDHATFRLRTNHTHSRYRDVYINKWKRHQCRCNSQNHDDVDIMRLGLVLIQIILQTILNPSLR